MSGINTVINEFEALLCVPTDFYIKMKGLTGFAYTLCIDTVIYTVHLFDT